jgi:hypothetical protein
MKEFVYRTTTSWKKKRETMQRTPTAHTELFVPFQVTHEELIVIGEVIPLYQEWLCASEGAVQSQSTVRLLDRLLKRLTQLPVSAMEV